MYDHLVRLIEEEKQVQEMLNLPVRPRLSVVDESRVAILRPSHREELELDDQFVAAEKEMREGNQEDEEQTDGIGPGDEDQSDENDQTGKDEKS